MGRAGCGAATVRRLRSGATFRVYMEDAGEAIPGISPFQVFDLADARSDTATPKPQGRRPPAMISTAMVGGVPRWVAGSGR